MDNRLQILSLLMLLAMLSLMATQSPQSASTDARLIARVDPAFLALPTVLAMSIERPDLVATLVSMSPDE